MSTYLVICDDKKPNLFLKELILSWAIIGRFLFFPLKFSRKPAVKDVLLLLLNEADPGQKGCSTQRDCYLRYLNILWFFKIFQKEEGAEKYLKEQWNYALYDFKEKHLLRPIYREIVERIPFYLNRELDWQRCLRGKQS